MRATMQSVRTVCTFVAGSGVFVRLCTVRKCAMQCSKEQVTLCAQGWEIAMICFKTAYIAA